jgi:hypothetical protein
MARMQKWKSKTRAEVVISHCADKVGMHLAWGSGVAVVVHQFVSYHFVKLIFDGLKQVR